MHTTQLAVVNGSLAGPITCTLTDEVLARIDEVLQISGQITVVVSDTTLLLATETRQKLQRLRLDLDEGRKYTKAPVVEAARIIEDTYQAQISAIKSIEGRLATLSNDYALKIQREQEAERACIQKERDDAQREIDRLAREQKELAEAEAAARKKGDEAAARELADKQMDLQLAAAEAESVIESEPEPTAEAPIKVRATLDYEIAGVNEREKLKSVMEFASRWPDLCKIELKRSLVIAALNGAGFSGVEERDGLPVVPGLRVYVTHKSHTRSK